jgi:2-hydroxychromene-2-carboxylate isomerase
MTKREEKAAAKAAADDAEKKREELFAHMSDAGADLRKTIKDLRRWGHAPGIKILESLASMVGPNSAFDVPDGQAAGKVIELHDRAIAKVEELTQAAARATDPDEREALDAEAASYACTHAAGAAMQAARALGGSNAWRAKVRHRIVAAVSAGA